MIVRVLVAVALGLDGVLAGLSLDKVVVQLPARRRMGPVGYVGYARAADLGRGLVFYPLVGVLAALVTVGSFGVAWALGASEVMVVLLGVGAVLSVLHSITTGRAAPTMLRIGRVGDDERVVDTLLTRFAWWSAWRAVLQVATFAVVLAAVTVTG